MDNGQQESFSLYYINADMTTKLLLHRLITFCIFAQYQFVHKLLIQSYGTIMPEFRVKSNTHLYTIASIPAT